ncbi:MAG: peptide chain release factor 1 [Blastocatellia bacterium]|jgi:peptide chain release factor 1
MFEKLEAIESTYEELTNQMMDPAVISDQTRYTKIARQHRELEAVVGKFREMKKISHDIDGTRELIRDSDDEEMRELAALELPGLEESLVRVEEELKILLLPKDPNDEKNVILEVRAGTGGEEACLFAAEVLRMYQRYAEQQGWRFQIADVSETGLGGIQKGEAIIEGDRVYSKLKYESGVHRVQRVPQTETSGRIHTSAITVAVLPEAEEVDVKIEAKDLRIDTFCSSGPGGQSVNTTYSAVRLTHLPTGLVVSMQDEKSQIKNREKAMRILRSRLLELEMQKQQDAISAERRAQVGSGDRSEKIRTYNFKENRVTDHRIGLTLHKLDLIMEGDLRDLIDAVVTHYQAEKLKQETERQVAVA